MTKWILPVLASAFLLFHFAGAQQETYTYSQKPKVPMAPDQMAVLLSDPQIVGVFHAVNQLDIRAAELAQKKLSNLEVDAKSLAAQAKKDHKAWEQSLANIEKREHLSSADSKVRQDLLNEMNAVIDKLETVDGKIFIQDYLRHEVQFHVKAIDIFRKELIPNAKNPLLKELLRKGLTGMKMHMQRAGLDLNEMSHPK